MTHVRSTSPSNPSWLNMQYGLLAYAERYPEYMAQHGASVTADNVERLARQILQPASHASSDREKESYDFFSKHIYPVDDAESVLNNRDIFIGPPESQGHFKTVSPGFTFNVSSQNGTLFPQIENVAVVRTKPMKKPAPHPASGDPNQQELKWLKHFQRNPNPGAIPVFHAKEIETKEGDFQQFVSLQEHYTTDLVNIINALRKKQISSVFTRKLQERVIDAVYHFQNAGRSHGDMKPENILVKITPPPSLNHLPLTNPEVLNHEKTEIEVRMCDYAFTSLEDDHSQGKAGTPMYVPPETAYSFTHKTSQTPREHSLSNQKPLKSFSDMWGLGLILLLLEDYSLSLELMKDARTALESKQPRCQWDCIKVYASWYASNKLPSLPQSAKENPRAALILETLLQPRPENRSSIEEFRRAFLSIAQIFEETPQQAC